MDTHTKRPNTDQKSVPVTGFQRAVPVLLFAVGIFTALCFITASTGSFGVLIASFLLGLFSWAAYFLPVLLLLHAVFYFGDIRQKRRLSRLIFTIVFLVSLSALIHAFTYFNQDIPYSAAALYQNGQLRTGGGFIGGSIAFLITKAFGSVGLVIIALTVFALYITFFFAKERKTWARIGLTVLTAVVTFASVIERGLRALFHSGKNRKKAKQEKNKQEQFESLFEDDYILTDDGRMASMQIPQLGIDEQHAEAETGGFVRREATEASTSAPAVDDAPTPVRKTVSVDNPFVDATEDAAFTPIHAQSQKEASEPPRAATRRATANETADEVFSGGFASFDLAVNMRLADKASSKTVRERSDGVREYADSLEHELAEREKRQRQEEFERKKQESLSYMQKTAPKAAPAQTPPESTYTPTFTREAPPAYRTEPAPSYTPSVTPEPTEQPASTYAAPAYTAPEVPPTAEPTPAVVPPMTDAEPSPVRATPSYTTPTQPTIDGVQDIPAPARKESMTFTFSGTQDNQPMREEPVVESAFTAHMSPETKPFAPMQPVMEEVVTPTAPAEQTLTMERTLLDPQPQYPSPEPPVTPIPEPPAADMPDEDMTTGEIPPEERNPNIEQARKYFSIFDEPTQDEEDEEAAQIPTPVVLPPEGEGDEPILSEEDEDEDEEAFDELIDDFDEEDMPPFDIPARISAPSAAPAKKERTESTFVEPDYSNYQYPPIDLLTKNVEDLDEHMEDENRENAEKLHNTLESFGVVATVRGYDRGPRITRFEIVPAQGTRVNKVTSLFDDITLALAAKGIRMEAPIPGKRAIGVEIPNKKAQTVRIRDLIEDDEFSRFSSRTIACIGKDVTGNPVYGDIAKMPHLLVAGATGMGKSVSVNSMLISILFRARPDEVKLIIFDPKKVDFQGFNGIPHLLVPVVTEAKAAAGALMWAVDEMEKRFSIIEKAHVKKIDDYNAKVKADLSLGKPLPKIIIVIDELNDLMLQVKNPVETLIMRIAQKARAAGIHLIIGTQRPSVNVLTGVIKANIPSRMSCKVASNVDSRTVLEVSGAEKLLNNGDMLYFPVGSEAPMRVQGAFVSDEEMEAVMDYLRTQAKGEIYDPAILEDMNRATARCSKDGDAEDDGDDSGDGGDGDGILNDPKFLEAADVALSSGKISTALLQRRCSIGYGRAAKYIDYMVDLGLVSEPNGQKPRDVLMSKQEWNDMLDRRSLM